MEKIFNILLTKRKLYINICKYITKIQKGENKEMEENQVILTQEGYDNLEKELDFLKTEKRAEIAEKIKVALGFGDLSENSEYDEAKSAQADNEIKIAELENKLRYAKIT